MTLVVEAAASEAGENADADAWFDCVPVDADIDAGDWILPVHAFVDADSVTANPTEFLWPLSVVTKAYTVPADRPPWTTVPAMVSSTHVDTVCSTLIVAES